MDDHWDDTWVPIPPKLVHRKVKRVWGKPEPFRLDPVLLAEAFRQHREAIALDAKRPPLIPPAPHDCTIGPI